MRACGKGATTENTEYAEEAPVRNRLCILNWRREGLEKDGGRASPGGWGNETVVRIVFIHQAREGKETCTRRRALCFSGMIRGPFPNGDLISHVRPHRLVKRYGRWVGLGKGKQCLESRGAQAAT